jgi:hypothetical protein
VDTIKRDRPTTPIFAHADPICEAAITGRLLAAGLDDTNKNAAPSEAAVPSAIRSSVKVVAGARFQRGSPLLWAEI